jgi:uncharacterized membrane protein
MRSVVAGLARHWLGELNGAVAVFIGGAIVAPLLGTLGWAAPAQALYAAYHLTCHQWAFRSFFLFGAQPVYAREQLEALGRDPFGFAGDASLGWKMAFCERDLAIYTGVLLVGAVFACRRRLRPLGYGAYALLALPMAVDGFTQLFGWRESTWELRVITGLLFGLASAWLVYPRLDDAFGTAPPARRYAPEQACAAVSPRG